MNAQCSPPPVAHGEDPADIVRAHGRIVLILAPALLLATTYAAFHGFVAVFGLRTGYFLGFLFKWTVWCTLVPLWLFGRSGVREMFRASTPRVGRPTWLGWGLLVLPVLVGYGFAFPRVLPLATLAVVALSLLIAVVNGTLEEVFWRGAYVRAFPGKPGRAWLYPSLGFGLWHLAPQSVFTGMGNPGGAVAFVGVATLFGLCWGWVAYRTGSIRWPVVSHVLLDLAGLGGRIYLT